MPLKRSFVHKRQTVQKRTRAGNSGNSKGAKKYRGQGGPRKRCKTPKR